MARSATSIRSGLRRIIVKTSGKDFRFSCASLRGFLLSQPHLDDKCPVLLPSNHSDDTPSAATLSQRFHSPCGWHGGEEVHSSGLGTSVSSCRSETCGVTNSVSLIESKKLKLPEQRWRHQSRSANSTFFGLHPFILMGSRGFASGSSNRSSNEYTPSNATPTSSSDGSTQGVGNAVQSIEDAYSGTVDSTKVIAEVMDVTRPFLEAHPPVAGMVVTVITFAGAWVILPSVLRQLHRYLDKALMEGQEILQTPFNWKIPYDLSIWEAMEDPARSAATLWFVVQFARIVAPASQNLSQFWTGGSVLFFVWFLHRWKTNVIKRMQAGRQLTKEERDRYSVFDRITSLALMFAAALGLAEAAGVAVSSLLTVGGIGGIVTAYAGRQTFENIVTGFTLSFSKPFTVGDIIKAGPVEGKVEEMGMISTRLLDFQKRPMIVPNAFFATPVIINKSRAPWRYLEVKIPIRLTDFEKVPIITLQIQEMLHRNSQVYLEEDKPRCHVAQFSPLALELGINCNIKPLSTIEYLLVEQGILVEAARIITRNGATLGGQ